MNSRILIKFILFEIALFKIDFKEVYYPFVNKVIFCQFFCVFEGEY